MARPAKTCSTVDCPHVQPCPIHAKEPWAGSKRRQRTLRSGSRGQKRARFILRKYNGLCHVCGQAGAGQVDHVIPLAEGGADDETNLRPIHATPCHRDKTAREAARARKQTSGVGWPD